MSVKPKSRTKVQQTPDKMLDDPLKTSESLSKRRLSRSGGSKKVEAYLLDLAKNRDELARNVSEVPPSPPHPSQDEDEVLREERIKYLRSRVQEAWAKADGNPSDGKWVFLTHLLRMGATSGRGLRWAGARADLKVPEPIEGWVNAQTEAEWNEWEKRDKVERAIKEKVENWKRKVEPPSAPPIHPPAPTIEPLATKPPPSKISDRTETTTKVASDIEKPNECQSKSKVSSVKTAPKASTIDPLKDAAPFGFSVVKKPAHVKGKPSTSGKKKAVDSDAEPGPGGKDSATKSDAQVVQPPGVSALKKNTNIQRISDVSEFSFLQPSFPSSVIQTSTPKPNAKPSKPRKPEPIPHATSAPPTPVAFLPRPTPVVSPLSPRITKTYGRYNLSPNQPLEASASLPAIPLPSSPTRNVQDTPTNVNNKRVARAPSASPSDGRVLKKARTMPAVVPPTSPIDLQARAPSVHTPKSNSHPVVQPSSSPLSSMPPLTPKKPTMPTLTDLLASAKKGKGSPKRTTTKSRSGISEAKRVAKPLLDDVEPSSSWASRKESLLPSRFPSAPAIAAFDEENPYMLDPYAISAKPDIDNLPPVDVDLQSPTKSLSSLAGSDSEDDDELEEPAQPAFGPSSLGGAGRGNRLDFSLSFHPAASSTHIGPFVAAAARKSGVSQVTGDSWASVYAAAAAAPQAPRPPPASSAHSFPYAYNSQFESQVAKQVDKVDRLLEKDVDCDYDGWLRDPEEEEEDGGVGGFGQNSLGVGDSSP